MNAGKHHTRSSDNLAVGTGVSELHHLLHLGSYGAGHYRLVVDNSEPVFRASIIPMAKPIGNHRHFRPESDQRDQS